MNSFLSKFVAFTHTPMYTSMITHAPLAVAIVLGFRSWPAFFFAATIGIWKDMWIDTRYGDTTPDEAIRAEYFYLFGAVFGAWFAGML